MTDPRLQGPGRNNDPSDFAGLIQQLVELKRQVNDLSGSILKSAGLSAEPDVLRVLGSMIVEGDLSVPNGSINNDALANPLTQSSNFGSEYGMGLGTSESTRYASFSTTVPNGYSKAYWTILTNAQITNSTASTQYIYLRSWMDCSGGWWTFGSRQMITLAAGFTGSLLAPHIRSASGLTGGQTLTVSATCYASAAIATNASNGIGSEAVITFTR